MASSHRPSAPATPLTSPVESDDLEVSSEPQRDRTNTPVAALQAAFVRRFALGRALWRALPWRPLWIGVVTDSNSAQRFETLRRRWKGFTVAAPLEGMAEGIDPDTEWAIRRYPERYAGRLRLLLGLRLGSIAGIVVGEDLSPWVRHFVFACKSWGIRTVLWPDQSFTEADIATPPAPRDTDELLALRPWTIRSAYGREAGGPDSPATDFVLANNPVERRFFTSLGYPTERVLCLDEVPEALRDDAPSALTDSAATKTPIADRESVRESVQVERVLRELGPKLAALRWPRPSPYVPGDPEPLFSADVEPAPRAGLVAYHREIDAASLYVPAMLGFRRMTSPTSMEAAQTADIFAYWGGLQGESRKVRLSRWARRLKRPRLLLEDGLFRSVEIGLSGTPALSIMLDDRGAYYDATVPNRLENLLVSRREFTDEERARARSCIRRIAELRLSKYNHAPDRPLDYPKDSVLLVDQRRGDLSVTKGLADETSFRDLLRFACRDNPDRTILVKRHPDAMSGGKQSYFSSESLAEWGEFPNLVLIDYETNPHALFDCCSKVYVVTSGMGFEALMRGLEVHCFGMPFYAGWGLTKDRRRCSRRGRRRTIEEVFFAACILHSRYFDPTRLTPCAIEDAIEALALARDGKHGTKLGT
ncbi:MAG: hypothetical protein QM784_24025 [Polyangiaceae bacterium]